MKKKEVWKGTGISDYKVSNLGNIMDSSGNKIKAGKFGKSYVVRLKVDNGFAKYFKIHRLVAVAFVPNPNPSRYNDVVLKDRKKYPTADNLVWRARSESVRLGMAKIPKSKKNWNKGVPKTDEHKKKISLSVRSGKRHHNYKGTYSCDGVVYKSLAEVAKSFNITPPLALRRFRKGYRNWKLIPDTPIDQPVKLDFDFINIKKKEEF